MISQPVIVVLTLISVPIIDSLELKLVQVLCRHGDRAPSPGYQEWYPTDPYINEKYAPAGHGGLTEDGRKRSFALGQFLRKKYFPSLKMPAEYVSTLFRVRSSDVERCRKSAAAVVTALFPGNDSIPIAHQELFKDSLFLGTYICPTIRNEVDRTERTMKSFEDGERSKYLYEYLSQHLGLNATRRHAVVLYDTLVAQSSFGLSLPTWTKEIYPSENLERNAGYEYVLQSSNTKLKRVNGGLWIQEFIKNMDNVAKGKDLAKMILYVGHDTNVAGFLSALDIFQPHVPGFSSCVILEMHEDPRSDQRYLRLFYKNYEKLEEIQIPRCSSPCSFIDFELFTEHLIPQDINKECGLTT